MNFFVDWLNTNTTLSDSSIYKYSRAAFNVSNEMYTRGVISKPLHSMNILELESALSVIMSDDMFRTKNKIGNAMYSNALKHYRAYRKDSTEEVSSTAVESIIGTTNVSVTERTELIKSRVGQGTFRQRILRKYDSRCIITGIDCTRLLLASHIKPWAVSNNSERLDVENGLCLSASYDRLFDIGLISFSDKGKILISSQLSSENAQRLCINNHMIFDLKVSPALCRNMEYHRDTIFIR